MKLDWSFEDRRTIYQRGLGIRGVAAGVFLALFVGVKASSLAVQIPALDPLNAILGLLIAINPLLWLVGRRRDFSLADFRFHWALDLVAVTGVVYCLGTLDVPLAIATYMIMIVTSATFSTMRTSFWLAALSAGCLTSVVGLEEARLIPHQHVAFAAHLTAEGKLLTVGGSILLFFVFGYLAGTLAGQLRQKTVEIHAQKDELATAYNKEQTAREGMVLLSALVQHDVYSPLGAIAGACSEALRSCKEGDINECAKFVAMIDDRLRSIESAVGALGLFQLADGEDVVHEYELRDVAVQLLGDLNSECAERRVEIAVEGEWPRTCVMRQHIYHVLRNLVTNSLKSVNDDGTGAIVIRAGGREHGAYVAVIDNGPGVSPAARERLFQLSTPKPTRRPITGLGAGLALSSNLVRNWGGVLQYEPGHEGGSIFTIAIPPEGINGWSEQYGATSRQRSSLLPISDL